MTTYIPFGQQLNFGAQLLSSLEWNRSCELVQFSQKNATKKDSSASPYLENEQFTIFIARGKRAGQTTIQLIEACC